MTTAVIRLAGDLSLVRSSPHSHPVTSGLTLAALDTAVTVARLHTAHTVDAWRLQPLARAAELVTVELVRRAVTTTGVPGARPDWSNLHELNMIQVRLCRARRGLIVEVWDADPAPPGRLSAVEQVSARTGVFRCREGGKVIWAEIYTPPPCPRAEPGSLPRRVAQAIPPPRAGSRSPAPDHDTLCRVLDGLHRLE
ncbi:hypothetical protein L3Q67_02415 [Saccharothrix sp. AJ9571]|nr:hypothetical protein L3Q67_02415 [Saccharothrix sp. AJ9571]